MSKFEVLFEPSDVAGFAFQYSSMEYYRVFLQNRVAHQPRQWSRKLEEALGTDSNQGLQSREICSAIPTTRGFREMWLGLLHLGVCFLPAETSSGEPGLNF